MTAESPISKIGLEVRNASVTYQNGHTAISDVSFSLPVGTIAALVGENGSGKSTLFKAIMGFAPVRGGLVKVFGRTVKSALREGIIAYVPQSEDIDWTFPVRVMDVVLMGRYGKMGPLRRARKIDREAVAQALDRVGMSSYASRQIGQLSGGQKKRVFLARALAQEGQVMLLDEPFTGVDVTTEESIVGLLRELRDEGQVILISTHNLGSVPLFCDRTILLNRTIIASGETAQIFTEANLRRAFGGNLRRQALTTGERDDRTQSGHSTVLLYDDEHPVVLYDGKATPRAPQGEV